MVYAHKTKDSPTIAAVAIYAKPDYVRSGWQSFVFNESGNYVAAATLFRNNGGSYVMVAAAARTHQELRKAIVEKKQQFGLAAKSQVVGGLELEIELALREVRMRFDSVLRGARFIQTS